MAVLQMKKLRFRKTWSFAHQLIKELRFQLFRNPKCFPSTQEPDLGIWGHRTEGSAKALGANPKAFLMLPDDKGKPIPGKDFRRFEEFLR